MKKTLKIEVLFICFMAVIFSVVLTGCQPNNSLQSGTPIYTNHITGDSVQSPSNVRTETSVNTSRITDNPLQSPSDVRTETPVDIASPTVIPTQSPSNITTSKVPAIQLIEQWRNMNFPDDYGGFYIETINGANKYTIILVNVTESRENEIRALVSNPDSVIFKNGTYSYYDLLAAQLAIRNDLQLDGMIISCGIGTRENRLVVGVEPSAFESISNICWQKYGGIVIVQKESKIYPL